MKINFVELAGTTVGFQLFIFLLNSVNELKLLIYMGTKYLIFGRKKTSEFLPYFGWQLG